MSRPLSLPLRYRLPNPPPVFVGREHEAAWLAAALARAPVVVIHGPGGIGKSALALRTVHRSCSDVGARALFVGVRAGQATLQVRRNLLLALRHAGGRLDDADAPTADAEALTEAAIDLAEAGPWWILLDDVHHADLDEMRELLTQIASYCRESRWIATSRADPRVPALGGQVLGLDGLSETALAELAAAASPGRRPEDLGKAVAAASGSPWALLQHLATGAAGVQIGRQQLLAGLPDEAVAFLRALATLAVPLSVDVLGTFSAVPSPDILAAMERRGLVAREGDGLRLHDVLRGFLFPAGAGIDPGLQAAAADALAADRDPELVVEAARLLRDHGSPTSMDRLCSLLAERGEHLLASGQVAQLWRVVAGCADARLNPFRLRLAAALGSPTALSSVSEPPPAEPRDLLAWAQALYARDQGTAAAELASKVATRAAAIGDAALAAEAALVHARCHLQAGQVAEARALLAGARGAGGDLDLRLAAASSLCQALLANLDLATTTRRERLMDEHQAAHDVALALHLTGRPREALRLVEEVCARTRGASPSLLATRQVLLLCARLRLGAGDLAGARALLERLRPFARGGSVLRAPFAALELECALADGPLSHAAASLSVLLAGECADHDCRARAALASTRVALWRAAPELAAGEDLAAGPSTVREDLVALRRVLLVRAGGADPAPPAADARAGTAGIADRLIAALAQLLAGHPDPAADLAADIVVAADEASLPLLAAEARQLRCDALAAGGRQPELERAAAELGAWGARAGIPRLVLEARLYGAFGEPAVLEELAIAHDEAPTAARRARALLAATPRLDAVDRLLLEALARRGTVVPLPTLAGPDAAEGAWLPGWGIDEPRAEVWLGGGRRVPFAGRPLLWRILLALLDAGGRASKERLAHAAWDVRGYHPLHHDPRLHVAVRKLRELLEDDPTSPTRLLTTDDGYRLGGPVRRRAAVAG